MAQSKRVILRVREADVNWEDPYEPVRLYLELKGRSATELEENRHYIHLQPPNSHIPQLDPKIHIVIDFETAAFSGVLGDDFPHELYRVRRVDDRMRIFGFKDGLYYTNFLSKLRVFTDDLYPWGCTTHDLRVREMEAAGVEVT
ncbi:hypothetical protein BJX99DRAFT_248352 [Aspergillus californicus]